MTSSLVGEGIETMLSVRRGGPWPPCLGGALVSGHLGAVLLPEGLQRLYIAIDRDPAGQRAAERLSARASRGRDCRLGAGTEARGFQRRSPGGRRQRCCVSIWQGRSVSRIGSACQRVEQLHRAQGAVWTTAGQGADPVAGLDCRSFASFRGQSRSTPSPHGLQEMGRRPSKVPPLQGRGATDFRRRGQAPPLHRESQISRPPSSSTCVPAPKAG